MMKLAKLLIAAVFFFPVTLFSQSDLMLYDFNAIGQSLHLNPATPQQSKLWIGLPGISNIGIHYHNNAFALVDVFEEGTNPNDNLAALAGSLKDNSQLAFSANTDLLSVGFKAGNGFVSFGANQSIDHLMDMPTSLFQLLFGEVANVNGSNFSLATFDLENTVRTNFYAGYQHRMLNDKLTVGARMKFVVGQVHANIERSEIALSSSDTFKLRATTDILIKTAGAYNTFGGDPDLVNLALPDNYGTAFDIGVHYKMSEKWSFSGSVLDIGSITWKTNTKEYRSKGTFEFEGIEADLSNDDVGASYGNTMDTLVEAFNLEENEGASYTRALMSQVYLNAAYSLTEKHSFAAIYHARIWNSEAFHDMGIKYIGRLSRGFQLTAGYSVINGTYNNIGAGFEVKMGPVQFYVMSDNVLGGVAYQGLRTSNVRLGINLAFYGPRNKSEAQIKELEEEEN